MDAKTKEAIDLLRTLIATPSPSRDESRTADLIFAYLAEHGAAPERLHNNVFARSAGFDPARPTLLLNSHHDTVRPAASYTRDPYAPTVEGDRLYGLGSNDAGASAVSLTQTFLTQRTRPLPFNLLLENLAILAVPDSPSDTKQENTLLDERLLTTPSVAVGRAMLTGGDMAEICRTALLQAMSTTRVWNDAIADEVIRKEDAVDHYEDVLGTYLVKLSAKHLSVEDNRSVNTLLHTIGDFERVSDHAVNIIKTAQEIRDKGIKFSEEALNDLSVLEAAVQDIVNRTVDAFQKCDTYAAGKIEPLEQVVDGLVREVKTRHIARLQAGVCTIEYGFVLDDLLTNYERIADHCSNIAVAMIEVAADKFDTHEYLNNVKHGGSVKFERRYEKYRGRYTFPPEAYSEPAENPAEN